jgi:hypothetical protein
MPEPNETEEIKTPPEPTDKSAEEAVELPPPAKGPQELVEADQESA